MKKFTSAKEVGNYLNSILEESKSTYLETISEQLYKDSNEFTYRDTGDMYKSGQLYSWFNKGIITERTPYVRRRYYEGGKAGAGNPNARAHWFEETFKIYKSDYEKMYINALNDVKKV